MNTPEAPLPRLPCRRHIRAALPVEREEFAALGLGLGAKAFVAADGRFGSQREHPWKHTLELAATHPCSVLDQRTVVRHRGAPAA